MVGPLRLWSARPALRPPVVCVVLVALSCFGAVATGCGLEKQGQLTAPDDAGPSSSGLSASGGSSGSSGMGVSSGSNGNDSGSSSSGGTPGTSSGTRGGDSGIDMNDAGPISPVDAGGDARDS